MANALSGWLNNSEHPFEPSSIWAVPDGLNQHQHSRIASFYCLLCNTSLPSAPSVTTDSGPNFVVRHRTSFPRGSLPSSPSSPMR
jgi:hypothetical protein